MPLMKLVKTLLATTLALSAFSTFAATEATEENQQQVLISSQEQPVNAETTAAGQPTAAEPGSEVAAEESPEAPVAKPVQ